MEQKLCPQCDTEKPYDEFYSRGKLRNGITSYCKVCINFNVLKRIKDFKVKCVEYKGGECQTCGYSKSVSALEFHHRDPKEKEFGISSVKRKNFDGSIKKELDKCDLLCANCHREEHDRLLLL